MIARYQTYNFRERFEFSCCSFERICLEFHLYGKVRQHACAPRCTRCFFLSLSPTPTSSLILVLFYVPQHCGDFTNYKCSTDAFATQIKSRKMDIFSRRISCIQTRFKREMNEFIGKKLCKPDCLHTGGLLWCSTTISQLEKACTCVYIYVLQIMHNFVAIRKVAVNQYLDLKYRL